MVTITFWDLYKMKVISRLLLLNAALSPFESIHHTSSKCGSTIESKPRRPSIARGIINQGPLVLCSKIHQGRVARGFFLCRKTQLNIPQTPNQSISFPWDQIFMLITLPLTPRLPHHYFFQLHGFLNKILIHLIQSWHLEHPPKHCLLLYSIEKSAAGAAAKSVISTSVVSLLIINKIMHLTPEA